MSAASNAKVAVVTGAAMGIGAAIAEQLARDGMTVLVSDVNLREAEKTAQGFRDAGMSAAALQMDVGAAGSISAAFVCPLWPPAAVAVAVKRGLIVSMALVAPRKASWPVQKSKAAPARQQERPVHFEPSVH